MKNTNLVATRPTILALALLLTAFAARPAQAATTCSPWHYIQFGQTGLNIWTASDGDLLATGRTSEDYWNQQVMFCRDPGWSKDHYAIYSNANARFWSTTYSTWGEWWSVGATATQISNPNQLFEIKDFDGNFFTIKAVQADHYLNGSQALLYVDDAPLNGANLYKVVPRDLKQLFPR